MANKCMFFKKAFTRMRFLQTLHAMNSKNGILQKNKQSPCRQGMKKHEKTEKEK